MSLTCVTLTLNQVLITTMKEKLAIRVLRLALWEDKIRMSDRPVLHVRVTSGENVGEDFIEVRKSEPGR